MHTIRTILGIVVIVAVLVLGVAAALVASLGWGAGLLVGAGIAAVATAHYGLVLRPWHRRWGATDDEVHGPLPGDELVPGASATTRAIAIATSPEDVWPWLVQIGWGRAGWYSYDWIDNDGRPSADGIVPDWQDLAVGDRILMTPDAGFVVRELDPPHALVALSDDGSTSWCLCVTPDGAGSRLVSRFRNHTPLTPASVLWLALVDPGAFLMERKMLAGIAARAEAVRIDVTETPLALPATPARGHEREAITEEAAEAFLAGDRIAVVGASDRAGNMGGTILRELWLHGHHVVPVHPSARVVGGHRCYPTIGDVPGPLDGAIVVVPTSEAAEVVRRCIGAGVPAIWLFRGIGGCGAVSDEAIALCHDADVEVIPGACPLMFIRPVGVVHRIHRLAREARHDLVVTTD